MSSLQGGGTHGPNGQQSSATGRVVALSANDPVIEAGSGSCLTYRRRPARDPVVMPGDGAFGEGRLTMPRRPPQPRNPIAASLSRLGARVKPSAKAYRRRPEK